MVAGAACSLGLRGLLALLVVGYVGINFAADLPAFLVAENVFYAAVYLAGILFYGNPRVLEAVSIIAAFNAGRVSRSVVTPEGRLFNDKPQVVASHAALTLLVLAAAVAALLCSRRAG
ncbi:MAG: hypothetical protein LRS49_06280 [Desulfurococcales archaeon]|nr:hypothetical protein [Desulfurococcales archaeon]